jgi:hypothetical protein
MPDALADAIVAFLPDVWAVPPGQDVLVRMEEATRDAQEWQIMMWWPILLEDWVLVGGGEAEKGQDWPVGAAIVHR